MGAAVIATTGVIGGVSVNAAADTTVNTIVIAGSSFSAIGGLVVSSSSDARATGCIPVQAGIDETVEFTVSIRQTIGFDLYSDTACEHLLRTSGRNTPDEARILGDVWYTSF